MPPYSITSELFAKKSKNLGHKIEITQKIQFCGLSILCDFFLVAARPRWDIVLDA